MPRRSKASPRDRVRARSARPTRVPRWLPSGNRAKQLSGHEGGTPRALGRDVVCSYVLPIRLGSPADEEMVEYARWLATRAELIVVDGSEPLVFAEHARRFGDGIVHIAPDLDVRDYVNGKVAGVVTGIRRASYERVVIADDDVRYDEPALAAVVAGLDAADVIR